MSVLLINAKISLLGFFWAVSVTFLILACLFCLFIILRRVLRNKYQVKSMVQAEKFRAHLSERLAKTIDDPGEDDPLMDDPEIIDEFPSHIEQATEVLLHYFRTLRGKKYERLQKLVSNSELEAHIIKSCREGTRGVRMRAVQTLSYLNTQDSLEVIFSQLESRDKYIRLTAARCLVRRKADFFLNQIIESLSDAFPNRPQILGGILAGFGTGITPALESHIQESNNDVVIAGCLEALIQIMPHETSLDLIGLMDHPSDLVRAAALSLSEVTSHQGGADPLRMGLKDDAMSVKIKAAKLACTHRRADLTSELYKLSSDPELWVRYWALRAIWMTGKSGRQFVDTLRQSNATAADVALEMRSGYV